MAFRDCHWRQCGFCTPGMIVTAHELLNENLAPTAEQIRDAIAGNLCMGTGYVELPVSSRSDSPGFSRSPDWFR